MIKLFKHIANRKPGLMDINEYFVSAVLLPLVEIEGQESILFEIRSEHLDRQPGEICFPGGKVEEGETPRETSVRETSEELGISPGAIDILGPLDILVAPLGTVIYPYIGVINHPGNITPDPGEVADTFTVPLQFFLENPPSRAKGEVAIRYGEQFPLEKAPPGYGSGWKKRWEFSVYYYQYGSYFIWGMTSKILVNFINIIKNTSPEKIF